MSFACMTEIGMLGTLLRFQILIKTFRQALYKDLGLHSLTGQVNSIRIGVGYLFGMCFFNQCTRTSGQTACFHKLSSFDNGRMQQCFSELLQSGINCQVGLPEY